MDLQIENDGPLTAKDGGRIGQEGVEDPKVARVDLNAVHDCVLVHVEHRPPARRVE